MESSVEQLSEDSVTGHILCDACNARGIGEKALSQSAIRPYPARYIAQFILKNKKRVLIRRIRPEDEPLLVKFHRTLSEETVYNRYFGALKLSQRIAHQRLVRICSIDCESEIALVAEYRADAQGCPEILGVGRLCKLENSDAAEFAVVVSDAWHRQGLGIELLARLIDAGKKENIRRIIGHILPENHAMQQACRKAGFKVGRDADGHDYLAEYTIA